MQNQRGFTLIEIMVVIVILAAFGRPVGPKIIGRSDDAKLTDANCRYATLKPL
jgi:general secretion pathway protein G